MWLKLIQMLIKKLQLPIYRLKLKLSYRLHLSMRKLLKFKRNLQICNPLFPRRRKSRRNMNSKINDLPNSDSSLQSKCNRNKRNFSRKLKMKAASWRDRRGIWRISRLLGKQIGKSKMNWKNWRLSSSSLKIRRKRWRRNSQERLIDYVRN